MIRRYLIACLCLCLVSLLARADDPPQPFGAEFPNLDSDATGQLYPLLSDESREVQLELKFPGQPWQTAGTETVQYPGWSVHLRIDNWDNTRDVARRFIEPAPTRSRLAKIGPMPKPTPNCKVAPRSNARLRLSCSVPAPMRPDA